MLRNWQIITYLLSVCFQRRMLILYAGLIDVYTGFVTSGDDRPVIL